MKNFLLRYKKANNCAEKVKAKTSEYYYLDWRVCFFFFFGGKNLDWRVSANGRERIDK